MSTKHKKMKKHAAAASKEHTQKQPPAKGGPAKPVAAKTPPPKPAAAKADTAKAAPTPAAKAATPTPAKKGKAKKTAAELTAEKAAKAEARSAEKRAKRAAGKSPRKARDRKMKQRAAEGTHHVPIEVLAGGMQKLASHIVERGDEVLTTLHDRTDAHGNPLVEREREALKLVANNANVLQEFDSIKNLPGRPPRARPARYSRHYP